MAIPNSLPSAAKVVSVTRSRQRRQKGGEGMEIISGIIIATGSIIAAVITKRKK